MIHALLSGHYRNDGRYPAVVINITNRCNLTTPFCCYGNDVDCGRCGAWVVFQLAAQFGTRAA